jgi:hypothetical protein
MAIHVDAAAPKSDSLHFEAQALFGGILARRSDRASRAHHAMPGQVLKRPQGSRHLARSSRQTSRGGYLTVTRHLPPRDLADDPRKND